jgi:hypothetical protein
LVVADRSQVGLLATTWFLMGTLMMVDETSV